MEYGFSILMLIFAGLLLLYAALMAITKNYKILPIRARVSVEPKDPEAYTVQLAKVVALVALAIAAGAAVSLWIMPLGVVLMIGCVIAAIWYGAKNIMRDVE